MAVGGVQSWEDLVGEDPFLLGCVHSVMDTNLGKAFRVATDQSQMVVDEEGQEEMLDLPSAAAAADDDVGIDLGEILEGGNINQVVDKLPKRFAVLPIPSILWPQSQAALKPQNSICKAVLWHIRQAAEGLEQLQPVHEVF